MAFDIDRFLRIDLNKSKFPEQPPGPVMKKGKCLIPESSEVGYRKDLSTGKQWMTRRLVLIAMNIRTVWDDSVGEIMSSNLIRLKGNIIMMKITSTEKENVYEIVDEERNWKTTIEVDWVNKSGKDYYESHGKPETRFTDVDGLKRCVCQSKFVVGNIIPYKDPNKVVEKTASGEKKSGPVKKYNWLDYVNEDEKKIVEDYNELMKKCIKRHEDRINNPEYQLKLSKLRKYQELLKMADEDEVETITSIIEKLKKELGL